MSPLTQRSRLGHVPVWTWGWGIRSTDFSPRPKGGKGVHLVAESDAGILLRGPDDRVPSFTQAPRDDAADAFDAYFRAGRETLLDLFPTSPRDGVQRAIYPGPTEEAYSPAGPDKSIDQHPREAY